MELLHIIKGGLRQQVTETAYLKLYKPNGWNIDSQEKPPSNPVQETVKSLPTQTQVKNYIDMTRRQPKKFDDKLFCSDSG